MATPPDRRRAAAPRWWPTGHRTGDQTSGTPLAAALSYAARGWPVLPLHTPTSTGACSCRHADCPSPGKHPRTRAGLREASTSPAQITAWWRAWPKANIGVATGDLVVIDVDGPTGRAALAALQREHQPLPVTLRAGSARGHHLYLHAAGGHPVGNSAGRLGDGLDVRGRGGYVVAPPSRHASGHTYRWLNHRQPAPLPAWLADLLNPTPPQPTAITAPTLELDDQRAARYLQAAVDGEVADVAAAAPGTRNHTLNRAAFRLGQLAGAGALTDQALTETLLAAAERAGLPEREARATIASGLQAGRRHPRRI